MPKRILRILRRMSLLQQFRVASLVILVAGLWGVGSWIIQQIETGVIHSTSLTTSLYVESLLQPNLAELAKSSELSAASIQDLDDLLSNTSLGREIVSLKVWNTKGGVLYDTHHTDIGKTFPIEDRLARSSNGEVTTRISPLDSDENVAERPFGQLIETYSPIHQGSQSNIIGVIEFYQKMDDLRVIIDNAQRASWLVVAGVGLLMYFLLTQFVQQASNTITTQQTALREQVTQLTTLLNQNEVLSERVRNAARSITTLHERLFRRVGSEIHDGPAQELSLALLKIDGIMARNEICKVAGLNGNQDGQSTACGVQLDEVQLTVQQALQELRQIATGMSLPMLNDLSLSEVISRPARAHERKTGTRVELILNNIPDQAPLAAKITVYRLIQEALNNSYRHAEGKGQTVRVDMEGQDLLIELADRGPGFDVNRWKTTEDHLGLLGMRERIESMGGRFSIESKIGAGTTIMAHLPVNAEELAND